MNIKKVQFEYYKTFKNFTVHISDFNVLVGPNNCGKSTVLGAFKILSEGIRKANARKAEHIDGPQGKAWGHVLDLDEFPVSLENVFYNYDDKHQAIIRFYFENNTQLLLYFPESGICHLIPEGAGVINTPTLFKRNYPVTISFVPVLGPVEHKEGVYQKEAARKALLTHKASRNFRNIWHHYPEGFEEFRKMIQSTWPGMDINPPEILTEGEEPQLIMFCPEERMPREIYWAGFGFQVWCQMLTFILQAKNSSMLIIDEPDIYLHSDLQRQLVDILKNLGLQILIATHSIEVITEVDSRSLVTIHKKRKYATRISNPQGLQSIYKSLGSNANPTLTQIAKTKRAIFLEGKDFQLLSKFARKLKNNRIANRSDFAIVPVDGFNPHKVKDFSKGIEMTLGMSIKKIAIFDQDYRCREESNHIKKELKSICSLVIIHNRKEIENFLLQPTIIDRLIKKLVFKKYPRKDINELYPEKTTENILNQIADNLKTHVMSQYLSCRRQYNRKFKTGLDDATIDKQSLKEFEEQWETMEGKLRMVPGKEFLSKLNSVIQNKYKISFTQNMIVDEFKKKDMDNELIQLISNIDNFSKK